MKITWLSLFLIISVFFSTASNLNAGDYTKKLPDKTQGTPGYTKLNINKISTYFYQDGTSDISPFTTGGFTFPKGSNHQAVFQSGLVWGGKINGQIRVGGATYNSGLVSGKILANGSGEDPSSAGVRIYRVRPDYKTGNLSSEGADGEGSIESIRAQYEKDWNEWPASKGAPFFDKDGDKVYNPAIDIPGVPGAGQTIWFVCNDLDQSVCRNLYGSAPMNLEMQTTIWGYSANSFHGDLIFRKYKIINKGSGPIDEMYLSMWSDPDVGDSQDDLAGCDSTLDLAYCYNGGPIDVVYGNNPPAAGFQLLQGPAVSGSSSDKAFFNGRWISGRKNLPMTSFYYHINGDPVMKDPELGNKYDTGTLYFWNLFQGKVTTTGKPFSIPDYLGGGTTKFPLSGDPVSGQGYLDGYYYFKGDRRIGLVSGPFTLALQDTQEIVFAEIGAIEAHNSHRENIRLLKNKAANLKKLYTDNISVGLSANTLTAVNNPVSISSSVVSLDPLALPASYIWKINSAPAGSKAAITVNNDKAAFTPDVEGEYNISLKVTNSKGNSSEGSINITVTGVKAPTANFTFSKTEMTWGDSVLIDASSSVDPQNKPLKYKWAGTGTFSSFSDVKTYYVPYNVNINEVSLEVDNGTFTSTVKKSITTHPIIQNISIRYSLNDATALAGVHFSGDSLYLTTLSLEKNLLRIYSIANNGFDKKQEIILPPNVEKVVKVTNNRLYVFSYGTSGYFGPGVLNIYSIGSNWSLSPILQNYVPGTSDISSIVFEGNTAYLYDIMRSCYKVDFTNLSAPVIMDSYTDAACSGMRVRGNYIFQLQRNSANENKSIVFRDKSAMSLSSKWDFTNTINGWDIKDTLLFITYHDTLDIYGISGAMKLRKLSSVINYCPVKWEMNQPQYSYSNVSYLNDNIVCLTNGTGYRLYNVSNPLQPRLISGFYGTSQSVTFNNGSYYMVPGDIRMIVPLPETEICRINFNPTSVEESYHDIIPSGYSILQNYPNPFNPATKIKYGLPQASSVKISIYNTVGQLIAELVNGVQAAGSHEVTWNAVNLSSGVYYYNINAVSLDGKENFNSTKKMVLVK